MPTRERNIPITRQRDFINMRVKNKQDFWSGIMFFVLGVGFALGATKYSMGTAARMGPGYFPFWLGVCMALLGSSVTLNAMRAKAEEVPRSEEHTSELQSLMRISYAVFCLKKKKQNKHEKVT